MNPLLIINLEDQQIKDIILHNVYVLYALSEMIQLSRVLNRFKDVSKEESVGLIIKVNDKNLT